MLEAQLEGFEAEARLLDATLGVLSVTSQIEALARVPRTGEGPRPSPALVDFFLGIIAAGRTFRAALDAGAGLAPESSAPDPTPELTRVFSLR
jgi:hypothetical protein